MDEIRFAVQSPMKMEYARISPEIQSVNFTTKTVRYTRESEKAIHEIHKKEFEFYSNHSRHPEVLIVGSETYEHLIAYCNLNPLRGGFGSLSKPTQFEGMDITVLPDPRNKRYIEVTVKDIDKAIDIAWREEKIREQKRKTGRNKR